MTGLPLLKTMPELIYAAIAVTTSASVIAVFGIARTMMVRLAPIAKMSQFFGLYALSGTITAFLGPELAALVTKASHSQRIGMSALLVLLASGLVSLTFVREERAT